MSGAPWLYRDAELVVVDKPAGEATIPSRDPKESSCTLARISALLGQRLFVVHRLDRDTSGVLVFAGHAAAHRWLNDAFAERRVHKCYHAWTYGIPDPPQGCIELALHAARRGKMRPARAGEADALEARTSYAVEACWIGATGRYARVRLEPHTGRQHQLRVHLRAIACPILGDPLYARAHTPPPGLRRLALHASWITLPTSPPRSIAAPWPPELHALEAWLARHCTAAAQ